MLQKQIEATRLELLKTKPRSRRRIELEIRMRDLVSRQLRSECPRDRLDPYADAILFATGHLPEDF